MAAPDPSRVLVAWETSVLGSTVGPHLRRVNVFVKVLDRHLEAASLSRIRSKAMMDRASKYFELLGMCHLAHQWSASSAGGRRLIDLVFTALDSPYSVEILRGTSSPVDVVVVDAGPFRLAAVVKWTRLRRTVRAIIFASSLNPLDQHILDHAHVSVRVDRSGRQVARA